VISYFIFGANPSSAEANKKLAMDTDRTRIECFMTHIFTNCGEEVHIHVTLSFFSSNEFTKTPTKKLKKLDIHNAYNSIHQRI